MWKGKPVVCGNVGGIKLQIEDGRTGYLVESAEECAQRTVELFKDPKLRAKIGKAAKASVEQRFLLPRLAVDYLQMANIEHKAEVRESKAESSRLMQPLYV